MSNHTVESGKGKSGAVAVVGAGIAGIQASLDLAESGFKVYLIEKSPSIGGVMTQLDKTFPTNDCAMCIVSPKLVECSRHINIELMTYSEVESVQRIGSNFKIKVKKKARSVDPDKCTGCGICMEVCPVQNQIQVPEPIELEETEEVKETDKIISRFGGDPQSLIMILQDLNEAFSYLPEAAMRRVSDKLEIPYAEVYGTASFYKAFSLEPKGEHIIQVCVGTACHVRGAGVVLDELKRILCIDDGQTTDDGIFSLETVNCLGACALGPIVVVDGEYHGNMTISKVAPIIDTYAKKG